MTWRCCCPSFVTSEVCCTAHRCSGVCLIREPLGVCLWSCWKRWSRDCPCVPQTFCLHPHCRQVRSTNSIRVGHRFRTDTGEPQQTIADDYEHDYRQGNSFSARCRSSSYLRSTHSTEFKPCCATSSIRSSNTSSLWPMNCERQYLITQNDQNPVRSRQGQRSHTTLHQQSTVLTGGNIHALAPASAALAGASSGSSGEAERPSGWHSSSGGVIKVAHRPLTANFRSSKQAYV